MQELAEWEIHAEWYATYEEKGIRTRIANTLVRNLIAPSAIPSMSLEDMAQIPGLGRNGIDALRDAFPVWLNPKMEAIGYTPAQWGVLAELAERANYGNLHLSDLPRVVKQGILEAP